MQCPDCGAVVPFKKVRDHMVNRCPKRRPVPHERTAEHMAEMYRTFEMEARLPMCDVAQAITGPKAARQRRGHAFYCDDPRCAERHVMAQALYLAKRQRKARRAEMEATRKEQQ
jgi:hypothetical protein